MADEITRDMAADVMRKYAGHLMDAMAETMPSGKYPPLTDDEWSTAQAVLAGAGIALDRMAADLARALTAETIAMWIGGPE